MFDPSKTRHSIMSSHCIVPSWDEGNRVGQQQVEQEEEEEEEEEGEGQKRNKLYRNSPDNASRLVHMPNYGVRELTWENGQLTVHGLGGLVPSATAAKPIWTHNLCGCDTLESVVHQATLQTKLQSQDDQNRELASDKLAESGKDGSGARKRVHSDMDLGFCVQEESLGIGHSVSASASGTFDRENDARTMSWASYESYRSLKTARTGDKDYACAGWETQETEGEEQETKGETGRSCSRRGRAAAIHNESERRRRDRINQRMKTLQKLVPHASKTDKVSILDDVIEYLKQLQAQVQIMKSMRANLAQQMMVSPPSLPSVLSMQQHQQHQLQMSFLAAMAQMGMPGAGALGGFVPPLPLMVPPMATPPPQANKDGNYGSSAALPDPYSAFLAQTMNMDLYNKMAAAIYKQQTNQTTQVTSNAPSHSPDHGQGD